VSSLHSEIQPVRKALVTLCLISSVVLVASIAVMAGLLMMGDRLDSIGSIEKLSQAVRLGYLKLTAAFLVSGFVSLFIGWMAIRRLNRIMLSVSEDQ
jgi:Na+-transporting methylmalonyl-CoA/oxaloacetate decarboxylase beta subunit